MDIKFSHINGRKTSIVYLHNQKFVAELYSCEQGNPYCIKRFDSEEQAIEFAKNI